MNSAEVRGSAVVVGSTGGSVGEQGRREERRGNKCPTGDTRGQQEGVSDDRRSLVHDQDGEARNPKEAAHSRAFPRIDGREQSDISVAELVKDFYHGCPDSRMFLDKHYSSSVRLMELDFDRERAHKQEKCMQNRNLMLCLRQTGTEPRMI